MFNRLWHFILRLAGLAPYGEIRVLMGEIIKLEEECDILKKELEESKSKNKTVEERTVGERGGGTAILVHDNIEVDEKSLNIPTTTLIQQQCI